MKLLGIAFLCWLAGELSAAPPQPDTVLTRRLVGTWVSDPSEKKQWVGELTFNADGTGVDVIYESGKPRDSGLTVTMRWSIKDGILSCTSVISTDQQRAPVGLTLKDRIVSLTSTRYTYELYAGYGSAGLGKRFSEIRKNR